MKDIETNDDIKVMVDRFYDRVNNDPLLSPVFNDFANVNWEKHLPVMYQFWSTLLLGTASYKGQPFDKHVPLPIKTEHFDRWVSLFMETVDTHFQGKTAEEAKIKAKNIAILFQYKLKL
jgi:hemoglobin